jgi:hypothetical protein
MSDVPNTGGWCCHECREWLEDDLHACWRCGSSRELNHLFLDPPVPFAFRVPPVRWIRRLPLWLMGVLLVGILWLSLLPLGLGPYDLDNDVVFALLGGVLFLPGAIRRASWKHVVRLGLVGAIAPFLTDWLVRSVTPPHSPYWWFILWPTSLILFAGASEWCVARRCGFQALGWMLLSCLTVGLGFAVILFLLRYTNWVGERIGPDLSLLALAAVAWLAIPFGHRLAIAPQPYKRPLSLAMLGATLATCVAFFQFGVYTLARLSFHDHGPFSRQLATEFLNIRGDPGDYEFLWTKLVEADWNEPIRYPVGVYSDWRATAIEFLARRNRPGTAKRLAVLLRAHPSPTLIDASRGLFVEQQRYETAPIIMRFALVEGMSPSPFAVVGGDRHKRALEDLKVPQVAKARILSAMGQLVVNEAFRAREEGRPPRSTSDVWQIGGQSREYLEKFLGEDAGSDLLDWYDLYDEVIDNVATPLTPQLHQETSQVVNAFERYYVAHGKWRKWAKGVDSRKESEPAPPNWRCVTTTELETEVDRYVGAVDMLVGDSGDKDDNADPNLL